MNIIVWGFYLGRIPGTYSEKLPKIPLGKRRHLAFSPRKKIYKNSSKCGKNVRCRRFCLGNSKGFSGYR